MVEVLSCKFHSLLWYRFLIVSFIVYNKLKLSYDVASGIEITPCNKIDKPLVVYRFSGNVIVYNKAAYIMKNYNLLTAEMRVHSNLNVI